MRRFQAAERRDQGLQILTLPLLAARLAGGFHRPALAEDLEPAITDALGVGGFSDIEPMRELPGMTRAAARTLGEIWSADLSLSNLAPGHSRLADLARLEQRVEEAVPRGVLMPRRLRDLALRHVGRALAVLGPVELAPCLNIAPVWRPLLLALREWVPLSWREPATEDVAWFPGKIIPTASSELAAAGRIDAVSCADPRAEVVESLRWAHDLVSAGRARPEDIALCAPSTETWDEHFVTLTQSATLPVHFSNGVPALASAEGQACAALASVLLRGLSQERIRRLLVQVRGRTPALASLPADWARGLQPTAALFNLEDWRHALDAARVRWGEHADPTPGLWPILELLAQGPGVALRAGDLLLGKSARLLWSRALRAAPAQALGFSLRALKVADGTDPSVSIVWCSAHELVGAGRPWVRLLGLNTGAWPRRASDDPLLPDHVLTRSQVDTDPVTQRDRRAYHRILAQASKAAVLSHSRRDPQGRLLPASPLISDYPSRSLARDRRPEHAFNEADRLLARPNDAAETPRLVSAMRCWRSWQRAEVTPHDGLVRAEHPLMRRAIARVQSATSLRLMLRDPLAFVWRYALGWHSTVEQEEPLTLNARVFGELVHELLRGAVDRLEPQPGYTRATAVQLETALREALEVTRAQWPLERSVPPALLWEHTLLEAQRMALNALRFDQSVQEGTRCWTEVPFGQREASGQEGPWDSTVPVVIPNTPVCVRGDIDRLDLRFDRKKVRVSDYKTGAEPEKAETIILGGGEEVQRVIYALAVRQLLPEVPQIQARLVYLRSDPPHPYPLKNIDEATQLISEHVSAACNLLEQGRGLPGMEERRPGDEFRLLLPAELESYVRRKRTAFTRTFGTFTRVWKSR
jgi:RecB family exonuclease